MTHKSDKTYLIFMITLKMNKHRRVNLKNDLYIFGLNLSVLYIAVSVRGISRWWVGRVGNCPPSFWLNRRCCRSAMVCSITTQF